MNLPHAKVLEWLHRERDGRLGGGDRQALAAHLAACPDCRASATLAGRLERAGRVLPPPAPAHRRSDQELAETVLRGWRRRRRIWEPLDGAAWAAATVLLVLLVNWAIGTLLPSVTAGPPAAAAGSAPAPAPAAPGWAAGLAADLQARLTPAQGPAWALFEWIYRNFYLVGLAPVLLAALAGVLLGLGRAQNAWLAFLLALPSLAVGLIYWDLGPQNQGTVVLTLVLFPVLALAVALLAVHVGTTPRLRRGWPAALLLAWAAVLLLLVVGPWYGRARSEVFHPAGFLFVLLVGLLPALFWLASGGRWRRPVFALALGLSLVGLAAVLLGYFSSLPADLPWLGALAGAGALLLPVTAVVLAARLLFARAAAPTPPSRKRLVAGAAGIVLLGAALFTLVRVLALQTSVDEDPFTGIFLLFWIDLTALLAAVAAVWELPAGRRWAAVALILLFAAAMTPAAAVPRETAGRVTGQRAERIDRAILAFHADTGRYPAALDELAPDYLLFLPPPVNHWWKAWCYEAGDEPAGSDYYRLAYPVPVHFTYPGEVGVRVFASAGQLPDRPLDCEEEIYRRFRISR